MGCGQFKSKKGTVEQGNEKNELVRTDEPKPVMKWITMINAAILIQRWYRRYAARIEARRKRTWSIFQTLEYAAEQDQLQLYNFFNSWMAKIEKQRKASSSHAVDVQIKKVSGSKKSISSNAHSFIQILKLLKLSSSGSYKEIKVDPEEEEAFILATDPTTIEVPDDYTGAKITYPVSMRTVYALIDSFKKKQILHARYLLELMHHVRVKFKEMPNIRYTSTDNPGKQMTIVGDLHGKLDDLLTIFYKNGLPAVTNPYVFNGDWVDRGPFSTEISVILFCFQLMFPNSIFLNRGNHEDSSMNIRYGFTKELAVKYKEEAKKVRYMFEDLFSWLPLATVVDKSVIVMHGGISDTLDLEVLNNINRHKYASVLKPPEREESELDLEEWKQMQDILWSDPCNSLGCSHNLNRNGGCFWGPDVTDMFLSRNKLSLIVRSHECKEEGYEYDHNDQVVTIFSASNYYEIGSNKGAYLKLRPDQNPQPVQYIVTRASQKKLSASQKCNKVEESAIKCLQMKIFANESVLMEEFRKHDPQDTGVIALSHWEKVLRECLQLELPWLMLKDKLVKTDEQGVKYKSLFTVDFSIDMDSSQDPRSTEILLRNKEKLEMMFRAIDKDNSGMISLDEFEDACNAITEVSRTSKIPKSEIATMMKNMDINHDGQIDFQEFLEAFKIVDKFGRKVLAEPTPVVQRISDIELATVPSFSPAKK